MTRNGQAAAKRRVSKRAGRLFVAGEVGSETRVERDGVPRPVAMSTVGQKTEEVYRRYAIVDEAMTREGAIKMNRGAKVRRTGAQPGAQSNRR